MRPLIAALIALPLAAATLPADAATRNIPVPGFSRLRVDAPFIVRVHTGPAASVKASGPPNRLDRLVVESRGDTLVVSTERNWSWRGISWGKADTVYVDITVPMLVAVELAGSGDLSVDRIRTGSFSAIVTGSGGLDVALLDTARFNAKLSGSGDLSVAGKTGRAELSVTGSGDLRAADLTVGLLGASVLGSGDIAVGTTREARANVTGSGDIRIAGRPICKTSKMGSGDIRCGG